MASDLLASLGVTLPVLAAPMAGGPGTPALASAAASAGSLGFVAGGYKTPSAFAEELAAVSVPCAVNLFAPNPVPVSPAEFRQYAALLARDGLPVSDEGPIEVVDQDGNRYDATIVGRSPVYDLAVLYVEDARGLSPAALGSSRRLVVGEGVVAIGSPLGLSSTVTAGIVSALHRPVTTGDSSNDSSYINAVQTDAAINPGNSGGPLVNLRAQVVGVNSAIATTGGSVGGESGNIGVGFAIPIEQVKITADQILRDGKARYPVIGAKVKTGESDGNGAEVDSVEPGTPAEDGGLEKGDVVTEVDGARVTDGIALIVAIRTHQPGEIVKFTVLRDGKERTLSLTLDGEVG